MVETAPHPEVVPAPGGLMWRRSWRRRHATAPEAHQELVVLIGITGNASYLIDGVVHEVRRGTLVWALAGQQHFLLSESAEFDMWVVLASRRIVTQDPDMPPQHISDTGAALPPRVLTAEALEALHTIAVAQTDATTIGTKAAGLRLWLAKAWAQWQIAATDAGRHIHPAVSRAAQIWRQYPERNLKAVARDAGLSPGRLGRLFRAQIGKDVVTYRTEQKIRRFEAIKAQHPRLSLTSAALDAGFGSYTQFYRAWRTSYGTHPNDPKFR